MVSKLKAILEWYPEDTFCKFDDLDEAIIGVDNSSLRLIYSQEKIMKILREMGMNSEDAFDYYNFNIETAYFGENTPIICTDLF